MVITKDSRAGSNRENLISEFETGCLGLNKMTLYEFDIGLATVGLKKNLNNENWRLVTELLSLVIRL